MKNNLFTRTISSMTFIAATLFASIGVNAQTISTIAGDGTGAFGGDGGAATAAKLKNPASVKVDVSGNNIYIADYLNQRIRKIDASGNITTIAGSSSAAAYGGDGGAATLAWLSQPAAIAIDHLNNVYISDNLNHRIRKVTSGGYITTVAGSSTSGYSGDGGPATAALLSNPAGINVDSWGNVYFADYGNNTVRKIDVTTGIITTIAGNGTSGYSGDGGAATAAMLKQPKDVALDAAGNVYIADWLNNRIRKVTVAGIITTVAGTGTSGFSGDGGFAVIAQLKYPFGVWIDADTNIIISDGGNNRVRKVKTSGIIKTIAGDGTYGFAGDGGDATAAQIKPGGVTVDGSGNLYIADDGNHRIRKVTPPPIYIYGTGIVCEGSTTTLTSSATVGTWSSSDASVAAVDASGVITGVSSGTAIITYVATYGWEGRTVTVNAMPAPIGGTTTVCIAATTALSNVTTGGTWSSSASSTASIDAAGVVTGVAAGTATITYTVSGGCNTTSGITVLACTTEVDDVNLTSEQLKVYPNPSTGVFSVEMPLTKTEITITVTDMLGKTVVTKKYTNSSTIQCSMQGLPQGTYIIKVVADDTTYRSKIMLVN